MSSYAKQLTKQDLIERFDISGVTEDGRIFDITGKELKPHIIWSNGKRPYYVIGTYDKLDRVKVPVNRHGKETWNYKTITLGVHRIVYIWFHGIQPDGYVVDHINNDSLDNRLENLQLLTPAENLAKERVSSERLMKCSMHKSLEYYEKKLEEAIEAYITEKKEHSSATELSHKIRAVISQYRARIRYWKEHEQEYLDYLELEKSKKTKSEHYHSKANIRKELKEQVDKAREAYKNNPTKENYLNWKTAIYNFKQQTKKD